MLSAISFLKPLGAERYHFTAGEVRTYAPQLAIWAGAPMSSLLPIDCAVAAHGVNRTVACMTDDPELTLTDDVLTLRQGRLKVDLRTDRVEPQPHDLSTFEWSPCPADLPQWLAHAALHTADGDNWQSCVRITNGRVTALNNATVVDYVVPDLVLPREALLPSRVYNFLAKAEAPAEIGRSATMLAARWPDGRWVAAKLFDGSGFPERLDDIITNAADDDEVAIDDGWRASLCDAQALASERKAGMVWLTAAGFTVGDERTELRADISFATGLPEAHRSRWALRVLAPVIERAQSWCPGGWAAKRPCRFQGPLFRGAIMGVNG